jgi:hypothetical protein
VEITDKKSKNIERKKIYNCIKIRALIIIYVKGQRIQWFGHIMRKEEINEVRTSIECKLTSRRPLGRSKKRWMDR